MTKRRPYYRTPEQLRQAAWEAYEGFMHEYLEILRLWREYRARHGNSRLNQMKFRELDTYKQAIEELKDYEKLILMHKAMYDLESNWQQEVGKKHEWQTQQEAASD